MTGPTTRLLQQCLDRLAAGDPAARADLVRHSQGRLRLHAHRMLRDFPAVRRWEDTDDVLQNVLVRLGRMVESIAVASVRDYCRLAAAHVRRELIDLARKHAGPQGASALFATPPPGSGGDPPDSAVTRDDPLRLAAWSEFHRRVSDLPDEDREAFDLLWYQGLSQTEAAEVLDVSLSTLKRRWAAARLALAEAVGEDGPFF